MFDRILVEPGKIGGRPNIRGMRISVAQVVRLVAAGQTVEQILDDFPYLEAEDMQQALLFAAAMAEGRTVELPAA